jgi:hypothetical protein
MKCGAKEQLSSIENIIQTQIKNKCVAKTNYARIQCFVTQTNTFIVESQIIELSLTLFKSILI